MINKQKRISAVLAAFVFVAVSGSYICAAALTLTVGSNTGGPDDVIEIPIMVDNPQGIAGAAFTITYDHNSLRLANITSDFFDLFDNQWKFLDPLPEPYPPITVEVDGKEYDRPLAAHDIAGGTRVAAVRVTPAGAGENPVLFKLYFTLNPGAENKSYEVGVAVTELNNQDAGFDPAGEKTDMIIGMDPSISDPADPNAFTVLLAANANPSAGSITFQKAEVDTDNDGITDDWEQLYFGSTAQDGTIDSDRDGYSDLQEFINGTHPLDRDPAGGTGYDQISDHRATRTRGVHGAVMLTIE